jgi:hypothetical protein
LIELADQSRQRSEVRKLALIGAENRGVVDVGGLGFRAMSEATDFVEETDFLGGWLGNLEPRQSITESP